MVSLRTPLHIAPWACWLSRANSAGNPGLWRCWVKCADTSSLLAWKSCPRNPLLGFLEEGDFLLVIARVVGLCVWVQESGSDNFGKAFLCFVETSAWVSSSGYPLVPVSHLFC